MPPQQRDAGWRPLRSLAALSAVAGTLLPAPASGQRPPTTASAPVKAARAFTVATYNINYGNANLREAAETIRRSGAELVCLQETNTESAAHFRRHLADRYGRMVFRGGGPAGGFGILSKSPLRNVSYLPRTHGYFGALLAEASLGGKAVRIANVHLKPTLFRRRDTVAGHMNRLLADEQARHKEIAAIHKRLRPKPDPRTPAIILGDFNTLSLLAAPQHLIDRGFIDSFASVTRNADAHPTWHWPVGRARTRFRIDYIFHSSDIKTLRSRVLHSEASDHFLLVSTLQWRPPAPATQPAGS